MLNANILIAVQVNKLKNSPFKKYMKDVINNSFNCTSNIHYVFAYLGISVYLIFSFKKVSLFLFFS